MYISEFSLYVSERNIPYLQDNPVFADLDPDNKYDSPDMIYKIAKLFKLDQRGQEDLWCFYFTTDCSMIGMQKLSIGSVNRTLIPKREILQSALLAGAVNIILVHNHPSGSLDPSDEDLKITEDFKAACDSIGIRLLDHLIISRKGYYSIVGKE